MGTHRYLYNLNRSTARAIHVPVLADGAAKHFPTARSRSGPQSPPPSTTTFYENAGRDRSDGTGQLVTTGHRKQTRNTAAQEKKYRHKQALDHERDLFVMLLSFGFVFSVAPQSSRLFTMTNARSTFSRFPPLRKQTSFPSRHADQLSAETIGR